MKRKTWLASGVFLSVVAAGAFIACGGDDSTTVATDDGGVDGTAGDAPDIDTSTDDSGGAGDAGRDALTDATVQDVVVADAIVGDGGGVTDAGPGGDGSALSCGSASCSLPAQTCCVYKESNPPPPYTVGCSNGSTCPAPAPDSGIIDGGVVALHCEIQANCPANNVCCIEHNTSAGTIAASCKLVATCITGVSVVAAQMCDPVAADAGCVSSVLVDAGPCSSTNIGTWNLPNGFATCGGRNAN